MLREDAMLECKEYSTFGQPPRKSLGLPALSEEALWKPQTVHHFSNAPSHIILRLCGNGLGLCGIPYVGRLEQRETLYIESTKTVGHATDYCAGLIQTLGFVTL